MKVLRPASKMSSTRPEVLALDGKATRLVAFADAEAPKAQQGRMLPYFQQPELPADFKFMEPYIKGYERDWK